MRATGEDSGLHEEEEEEDTFVFINNRDRKVGDGKLEEEESPNRRKGVHSVAPRVCHLKDYGFHEEVDDDGDSFIYVNIHGHVRGDSLIGEETSGENASKDHPRKRQREGSRKMKYGLSLELLNTMNHGCYVNGRCIDAFLEIAQEKTRIEEVKVFPTTFYSMLVRRGKEYTPGGYSYERIKRWTDKNIFDYRGLVFPLHCQVIEHWVVCYVDVKGEAVYLMDSLGGGGRYSKTITQNICRYLKDERNEKYPNIPEKRWCIETPRVALQTNGYDCGVHAAFLAKKLYLFGGGCPSSVIAEMNQQDMRNARGEMKKELEDNCM